MGLFCINESIDFLSYKFQPCLGVEGGLVLPVGKSSVTESEGSDFESLQSETGAQDGLPFVYFVCFGKPGYSPS